jgi:hypothetical protein
MVEYERLWTAKELAYAWRQSPETIRRKVAAGQLPSIRLGSGPRTPIRIPLDELEAQLRKDASAR